MKSFCCWQDLSECTCRGIVQRSCGCAPSGGWETVAGGGYLGDPEVSCLPTHEEESKEDLHIRLLDRAIHSWGTCLGHLGSTVTFVMLAGEASILASNQAHVSELNDVSRKRPPTAICQVKSLLMDGGIKCPSMTCFYKSPRRESNLFEERIRTNKNLTSSKGDEN